MVKRIALAALVAAVLAWVALFATSGGVLIGSSSEFAQARSARTTAASDNPFGRSNRFDRFIQEPIGLRCTYLTHAGLRSVVIVGARGDEEFCPAFRSFAADASGAQSVVP